MAAAFNRNLKTTGERDAERGGKREKERERESLTSSPTQSGEIHRERERERERDRIHIFSHIGDYAMRRAIAQLTENERAEGNHRRQEGHSERQKSPPFAITDHVGISLSLPLSDIRLRNQYCAITSIAKREEKRREREEVCCPITSPSCLFCQSAALPRGLKRTTASWFLMSLSVCRDCVIDRSEGKG
jgi:hypothetical protein